MLATIYWNEPTFSVRQGAFSVQKPQTLYTCFPLNHSQLTRSLLVPPESICGTFEFRGTQTLMSAWHWTARALGCSQLTVFERVDAQWHH